MKNEKDVGIYKIMKETDWAYLASVVDIANWRLGRNSKGGFISHMEFPSIYVAVLSEAFSNLFSGVVCYKYTPGQVRYISSEEGGPARRIKARSTFLYIRIQDSRKMLFLIEKTEPYLRIKKPFLHVTKEFLKSKIYTNARNNSEEHEKRLQLIEEFNHIKKIHEQRREDGI